MSSITKRALENSLKSLLQKKPFDKITIQDITDDCGVSRMTFYYHFQDIYDLVEWAAAEDAKKALAGMKTYDTWSKGLLQIFYAVKENAPFILNVFQFVDRKQIERYLYTLTWPLMWNVIEEKAKDFTVREEDRIFLADYYKFAFVGIMLDWIGKGMKEKPEALMEKIVPAVSGTIVQALSNYDQKNTTGRSKEMPQA